MPDWLWHWSGYAVALLSFVGVLWALFWDPSRGRQRCRKCWYDLSGASAAPLNCPECGRPHRKPKHLTRTRRRWWRAVALALVMVVGGYGLWVVPRVQAEGRYGLIPGWAMPWAIWHVRLNRMPPTDRWQQSYHSLAKLSERDDHRERVQQAMQWWIRLGLVDPAGYYGRSDFRTSNDVMADPYGFSFAGAVFQNSTQLTDLPRWARHARIDNELSEISITCAIDSDENGDKRAAVEGGAVPFVFIAGTHDWTVEISTSNPDDGVLEIRSVLETADQSDFFELAEMTEQERIDAGWSIEHDPLGFSTMRPPPPLILREASPGEFPALVTAVFMGETVGVYEAVFVPDPSAGGMFPRSDHLRVLKLTRIDD